MPVPTSDNWQLIGVEALETGVEWSEKHSPVNGEQGDAEHELIKFFMSMLLLAYANHPKTLNVNHILKGAILIGAYLQYSGYIDIGEVANDSIND